MGRRWGGDGDSLTDRRDASKVSPAGVARTPPTNVPTDSYATRAIPQHIPTVSEPTPLPIVSPRRLAAFRERIVLRDPRGRSLRRSLVPTREGLALAGPFQVRRRVRATRAEGLPFVVATGDPNPIHREGEVVPGAFVAAQLVSAVEVLLPRLQLETLRCSFTGVSWYGRDLRLVATLTPERGEDGVPRLSCTARAFQDRREVADAVLTGRFLPEVPRLELPLARVDGAWLRRVVSFYDALGIDPEAHLHKAAGPDLSYPFAFLAALPSGSMVQRFQGQGGVLNRLSLEFQDKLPLAGPPEVSLELPKRLRASFNRILTAVKEGVHTAIRGTALVLPRAPEELLRPSSDRPSERGD